jgi:hypothetical protein
MIDFFKNIILKEKIKYKWTLRDQALKIIKTMEMVKERIQE